ncbi:MAG: LuxR C-terminal-related transcriptional regulator [Nitrospirales bacterium]
MKSKDWVGLIEAGYSLEGSDETWAENVLAQAAPLLNRGWWPSIATYQYTPTNINLEYVGTTGPSFVTTAIREHVSDLPKGMIDQLYRRGSGIGSVGEVVYPHFPDHQSIVRRETQGVIGDSLVIPGHTGEGSALALYVGFLTETPPTTLERKRWPLITCHLAAGLRLRSIARSFSLDSAAIEAIFDPAGKVYDLRHTTKEHSVRDRLRAIVRKLDCVRTRAERNNPDETLQKWEGLVDGRWSLVDCFDTDGRRFVVAIKNDPAHPDPRGLTRRERQVAEFIGLGQSTKEISYTLGVSHSAVTNCTARALTKLGLTSLVDLAAFFSPGGVRTRLAEISLRGEQLLVGAYPLINEDHVKGLTEAEREVLAHLIAGSTNNDIAQRRQTTENTVANQVKAIFRKLEVSSRSELATRVQSIL